MVDPCECFEDRAIESVRARAVTGHTARKHGTADIASAPRGRSGGSAASGTTRSHGVRLSPTARGVSSGSLSDRGDSLWGVRSLRGCCRPGCNRSAVATLTYVYSDSTAVVGPLATVDEPHSWDLCEVHASTTTAPKGWELVRYEGGFSTTSPDEDDLTALAEAVREAGRGDRVREDHSVSVVPREHRQPSARDGDRRPASSARTGRRGHLRVLPDPTS